MTLPDFLALWAPRYTEAAIQSALTGGVNGDKPRGAYCAHVGFEAARELWELIQKSKEGEGERDQ